MKVKLSQEVVEEANLLLRGHFEQVFENRERFQIILSKTEAERNLKKVLLNSKVINTNTTAKALCDLAITEFERSNRILAFKQSIQSLKTREKHLYEEMIKNLVSRIYQELETEYKLIGYSEKQLKRAIVSNISLAKEYIDVYKRLKQLDPSNVEVLEAIGIHSLNDEEFIYTRVKKLMEDNKK